MACIDYCISVLKNRKTTKWQLRDNTELWSIMQVDGENKCLIVIHEEGK